MGDLYRLENRQIRVFMRNTSTAGIYLLSHRVMAMPLAMVGAAIANVFFSNAAEARRKSELVLPGLTNMLKRIFDFLVALLGLMLFSPLLFIACLIIRMENGPVLFKQPRVGQGGRLFNIYKLRDMVPNAHKLGGMVTAEHDPRITKVGKLLRKCKLDVLPQLLNVVKGDMSLVGPRPEVLYYVDTWPKDDRRLILSVKPGITDYATFLYNDEQSVLADAEDPEKVYVTELMPHKLLLYRQYIRDQDFWLDIRILIGTLLKMVGFKPDFLISEIKLRS